MSAGEPRALRRLGLYCPDLPPVRGGVADHTLVLARALAARGLEVAVLGRRGDPAVFRPIPCRIGVSHRPGASGLAAACRAMGLTHLLVQYVPFLFARRGLAPLLVASVGSAARMGVRVGLFIHEPWVPPTRLVWRLTGPPMRRQLLAIVRRADAVFTPVPAFADLVRSAVRPGVPCVVAPIGSTVPVLEADRAECRSALGLGPEDIAVGVLSPAAAGAQGSWIAAAASTTLSRPDVHWLVLGSGSETEPRELPDSQRVRRLGWLPADALSRTLRALDVAVAPFIDGLTLRRTSAMAALAHGVPLVSSLGPLFDPALASAAACAADPEAFTAEVRRLIDDGSARRALGARGAAFYRSSASVEVAAAQVAAHLWGGP
jgi:glycosyltransferase involved in cell wall biosynthesis